MKNVERVKEWEGKRYTGGKREIKGKMEEREIEKYKQGRGIVFCKVILEGGGQEIQIIITFVRKEM